MYPRKMENFSFLMFDNQTELIKKKRNNIVITKKMRGWLFQRFSCETNRPLSTNEIKETRILGF